MDVIEDLKRSDDEPPRIAVSAYLTPAQKRHLDWLAKRAGQSASATIGKLIDRAYREAHGK